MGLNPSEEPVLKVSLSLMEATSLIYFCLSLAVKYFNSNVVKERMFKIGNVTFLNIFFNVGKYKLSK